MEVTAENFNIFTIFRLTGSKKSCVEFLQEQGILRNSVACSQCGENMSMTENRAKTDGHIFRCRRCDKVKSIRSSSFIETSKLTLEQFIFLLYFWSTQESVKQVCTHLALSEHTVCDWMNFIRNICSWKLLKLNQQIGGIGRVVQIDESLIYKPKYWVGHGLRAKQKWVVGFYDVNMRYGFARFIENRTSNTLLELIKTHIRAGTEVHTDGWSGYRGLGDIDVQPRFIHKVVNHAHNFRDPETGVHTNNVEAYWASLKQKFKRMKGTNFENTPSYVDEHEYIQRYGASSCSLFFNILEHISEKYIFE